jgi:7,8-dihydropterin-6-yl-methyl-4-(beta-D-ribofuranosyl)aminobenzene 5'-phosphate synthase
MEPALTAVDGVEFLVLVDNCLDSLSTVPINVTLEWPRLMRHGMKELSGEWQCCANHGLSLVITARRGNVSHTVMFDAGPEDYVLERNAPRLGVDFSAIEGIVLSHGHWDHAGGLPAAVRLTVAANRGGLVGDRARPLHRLARNPRSGEQFRRGRRNAFGSRQDLRSMKRGGQLP